jgi:hypothetical protein
MIISALALLGGETFTISMLQCKHHSMQKTLHRHGDEDFCVAQKHLECISESLQDFADVDGPSKFQEGRDSPFHLY